MKKLITAAVAMAMMAPSVAGAAPASQALSLKNAAAAQPVRASSTVAKKNRLDDETGPIILAILALGGIVCLIVCDGSDSD
jgi:Ni/Co efflux regulator RcnB